MCRWLSVTLTHWSYRLAIKPSALILGLRPANERRRYFVTTSLIGRAQAKNQPSTATEHICDLVSATCNVAHCTLCTSTDSCTTCETGFTGTDCQRKHIQANNKKNTLLNPVLLLRHDAVARILANGSAAFFESCIAIGWKLATASDRCSKTGSWPLWVESNDDWWILLTWGQ